MEGSPWTSAGTLREREINSYCILPLRFQRLLTVASSNEAQCLSNFVFIFTCSLLFAYFIYYCHVFGGEGRSQGINL